MIQVEKRRKRGLIVRISVPTPIRRHVSFGRDFYCQTCGLCPGDIDEYTGKEAGFYVDWVPNNGLSFRTRYPEIRTLCSTCNQGAKNITSEKPTQIWLLSQVRRAGQHEQRAVFEWLCKKFGK
jgi:hypothetical protein